MDAKAAQAGLFIIIYLFCLFFLFSFAWFLFVLLFIILMLLISAAACELPAIHVAKNKPPKIKNPKLMRAIFPILPHRRHKFASFSI